jgi:hypothetical protein
MALAQSDTTPPQLVEFEFTPQTIEVSTKAQIVAVRARATDDASGLASICVRFRSPSGRGQRDSCLNRISGDQVNGERQNEIRFPRFSESGMWRLNYVSLSDQAGNGRSLGSSELETLGFPIQLEVIFGQ